MKLKIVTGSTLYESAENILKEIDVADVMVPYFIVVPDRFTLQAERLLFKVLNIKSTFNINVVGLSSLAGKVIKEAGFEQLSALDGVLLVQKAMEEIKENLQYFTKKNPALCQELYKNIQQMKSSKIKPDAIHTRCRSINLAKKISDIKLIYEKYEELRASRIDADDVIEIFAEKIKEQNLYKDSVFIFMGFDSFTATNYSVIEALSFVAKEIRFAVSKPLSLGNAFIYEGDILNKLKRFASEKEIVIEVVSPTMDENTKRAHLIKNLFARQIQSKNNDGYVYVANSNSLKEEVSFVAKTIKKALYDGARFRDFAIICPSLDSYKTEIEVCFKRYDIVSYIDTSAKLSETKVARFIKKCFSLISKGFQKEDILYFLSSDLVDIEERANIIAFVNEKNISGRERFNFYVSKYNSVFSTLLCLKEVDSFDGYASFIEKILESIQENEQRFVDRQAETGLIQESSFESQALSAMKDVAIAFKKFNDFTELKSFGEMLLTALDCMEISSLPSFCDQVFVGDSTRSFFSKAKYIFVLGANAGSLPQNSNDNGLLSDSEIEESCFNRILEPTIKMINKRNRFKLFSALSQAEERLIVSYLNFNEEGQKQEKAYFVTSLMSAFNLSSKRIIQTNDISIDNMDSLLLYLGNSVNAKSEIARLTQEKNKFAGSVREALSYEEGKPLNRDSISKALAKDLFFKDGKARVTQIEKFYDCPFKHYIDNGLKPVEKKFAVIKPNTYGTIMHSLLEYFVKKFAYKMYEIKDKDISKFIEANIEKYLDEKIVDFLPDKELFLKELKDNALKLCKRAVYECQNSKFKPAYFEKRFDGKNLALGGLNVIGSVDRVDVYEDMFRVIDYKTGKITSALLSSLYYGKKLQLFLYGNSLRKELNLDFAGAFYFDAKISYSKNEKTILKGVFKPKEKVFFALDKRLEDIDFKTSDIVSIQRTSTGFCKEATSQPYLSKLEEYALKITEKALSQLKNGFITPCPSADSCTYCDYRGVCLYDNERGYRALGSASKFFDEKEGQ